MRSITAPTYRLLWRLLLACAVVLPSHLARAAEVTVRAGLSRATTVVGEQVQYQIKISGARRTVNPPEVKVNGLDIRYAGPVSNSVMRFNNGNFASERTLSFIYQVAATQDGTFTIPAVTLDVDGQTYQTQPVGLKVQPKTVPADAVGDPQAAGFAELIVPKKTVYVGETIPVEIRLYVDARIRWQPTAMPEIAGEGFTKQKMPEPERGQAEKNGRDYDVLVFKTAITPSRAGKITLGPSELPYAARIPRARRGGPRSLFDMFDDEVFGDPMFSSTQQLKAIAGAVEMTVKPLPTAGKPRDFSGAVGQFKFAAEGAPSRVKVGDPVTMKLRITGRGNFDRMSAPALRDATGWRAYPPSNSFQAEDDIGYSGTKIFEMAVVPEIMKTATPVFEFSYFDPLGEKYVTLKSAAGPLTVEAAPTPVAPPAVPANPAASPDSPPPAPERPTDILGLRYDPHAPRDGVPLHARREFWMMQGGMGLALLVFLGLKLRRRPDVAARTAAGLRREKTAAWARLRGAELGHVDFFQTAARIAQIETALATGRDAATIDAAMVRASGAFSDETRAVIDEIFSVRAELLYAGGGPEGGTISPLERERVMDALRELEKSHGRS